MEEQDQEQTKRSNSGNITKERRTLTIIKNEIKTQEHIENTEQGLEQYQRSNNASITKN